MGLQQITPLVSVVIPCFNQEHVVIETLESVSAQTYRPLQVIVVNDGSRDNSQATIETWIQSLPPNADFSIKLINTQNNGVSKACELGFAHVEGEYTMRLDGDDTIPSNYVSELKSLLQQQPDTIGYCYTDAEYFGSRTGTMRVPEFSRTTLLTDNFAHSASLVRTSIIRKYGWFSQDMKHGFEDWEFWVRLLEKGIHGIKCGTTHLNYRQQVNEVGRLSGRNDMGAHKARAMRKIIHTLHPKLYRNPLIALLVLRWKIMRRLKRYLGLGG